MKTSFKMVAMLLGIGIFPVCAHAQKKVVIEDEEPNSIMFVSRDKAGDEIIRIMNDRSQMRFTTRMLPLPSDGSERKIRPWYRWLRTCDGRV